MDSARDFDLLGESVPEVRVSARALALLGFFHLNIYIYILKKLLERHQQEWKKCLNPDSNRDPPAYAADCSAVYIYIYIYIYI